MSGCLTHPGHFLGHLHTLLRHAGWKGLQEMPPVSRMPHPPTTHHVTSLQSMRLTRKRIFKVSKAFLGSLSCVRRVAFCQSRETLAGSSFTAAHKRKVGGELAYLLSHSAHILTHTHTHVYTHTHNTHMHAHL